MKSSNNSRVSKILAKSKALAKKGLSKSKELVKKGVEKSKQLSKDDKLVTPKDKKHHRREQELEVVAEAAEYHLHPNPFHYSVYGKGGTTINYTKKWKVVGIDMFGKKFETIVTLGRMSNQDDVKNSIKRMPNLKVRQITMIKEVMAKGGEINEQEELKKIIKEDYPKFIELLGENIKDVKFRKLVVELAQKNAVKYDVIDVECEKLIPTQNEISINNSLFYPLTIKKCTEQYFNGEKVPIKIQGNTLVTCDNGHYIIDGHHRWSQVYVINPKAKMVCTDFYQLKSPLMGLKATQLGISADLGYLPIQKVEDTNMLTASEETIKKYIREVITDECREVFTKNGITDPEEHIWKNVLLMKKHNMPIKNASKRDLMPQTDMAKDFAKFTPKISKLSDGGEMMNDIENRIKYVNEYYNEEVIESKKRGNFSGYERDRIIKNYNNDLKSAKKGKEFDNFLFEAGYQSKVYGKKFADGGILIPQQGTLYTKDKKSKLEYYKKGNDYAFKVYDVENNPVENYTRNQYKKRSDEEALMTYNQFINYLYSELYIDDKMAMGGETTFDDKVKAVKSSLLKRKKVSPKVQKDYGKTYSPKEAEESAKRIVGSQVSKWKERMGKK
jgi:hypothetical protein